MPDCLPSGSITRLFGRYQAGDPNALVELLGRLSPLIHGYCCERFRRHAFAAKSGADFANGAIQGFHELLMHAKLEADLDRNDLLGMLIHLAWQKQIQHRRAECAQKRGSGRVRHASSLGAEETLEFQYAAAPLETEAFDLNCRELLDALPKDLCLIAVRRLEHFTIRDIAHEMGCSPSTVKRKLKVIRAKWREFEASILPSMLDERDLY